MVDEIDTLRAQVASYRKEVEHRGREITALRAQLAEAPEGWPSWRAKAEEMERNWIGATETHRQEKTRGDELSRQLAEGRAKWISIEDRYPPVAPDGWSDLVQICADGEVCAGYWSEPDNAWMTGYDEIPNQNRITHWCPMADPPNAKQSTPAPDATTMREALALLKEIADWLGLDCEWSTPEQAECLLRNTIDQYYKRLRALQRSEPRKE